MHIPDGFINASTSLGAGVAAAGGVWGALRRAARTFADRLVPLAGLVAAYVFALQMLNFPVAAGTSGHLIGGVLAAVLVGPCAAAVVITVVLLVQGLVFADGGLSALGLNVVNMALLGGLGGYAVFRALRWVTPRTRPSVVVASGVAAGVSVVLAAIGFVIEYALGGTGNASTGAVFGAMVGTHVVIGIGEGVITALTVAAVLRARPDLVHGAADLPVEAPVRRAAAAASPR